MPENDTPVNELQYVWDEYRYRHALCWEAIYKVAAAAIALGVLPYPNPKLTQILGGWMLVPPALATLLVAFGFLVVNNELRLFAKIKVAHHELQGRFLDRALAGSTVEQFVKPDDITPENARWTLFDIYAHVLVAALLLLSFANTLLVCARWMPYCATLP